MATRKTKTSRSEQLELVDRYEGKMRVRKQRASLEQATTPPAPVGGRTTSPELATLASKYVTVEPLALQGLDVPASVALAADIRSLAASVLSQAGA